MSRVPCAYKLNEPYQSIQPRISELRKAGKLRDSGQRRRSKFNKKIIAWEAV